MGRAPRQDEDLERSGRVRDARGRVVKMLDPKPLQVLKRHDVIDAAALDAIFDELEPGARQNRRLARLVVLLVVPVVVIGIGVDIAIEGQPAVRDLVSTLMNPAIMSAIVGGIVASVVAARHARFARLKRVMLRQARCPHCGYGLTGVPPSAEDGATVCPECASAWRLDDPALARPEPSAAQPRGGLVIMLLLGLGTLAGVAAMLWFALR
jgi:predicted Zn-ribbon and HTH transcriptional regulator